MGLYIRIKKVFIFFALLLLNNNIFSQKDSIKQVIKTELNSDFKYFDMNEFIKNAVDSNCRFYFNTSLKLPCTECNKGNFKIEIYNKLYFFKKRQKLKYMNIELNLEKLRLIIKIKGRKVKSINVEPNEKLKNF